MARSRWQRAAERQSAPARRTPTGRALAGHAYYVWEEDPRQAVEWARELGEIEQPLLPFMQGSPSPDRD